MIALEPNLPFDGVSKEAERLPVAAGAPPSAEASPPRAVSAVATSGRIIVRDVVKTYHTQIGPRRVLDGISFDVGMGDKIAVLGKNGAGKSTLVKIVGGVETPTAGFVHRRLFMSWPLGLYGGFEPSMSGVDNIRFVATLYRRDVEHVIEFVDDFAELGRQLLLPIKYYSTGMRMRLAFALTLAVDFECFLIDEVLAVGDARFHRKCHDALFVARANCAMIMISHDVHTLRRYCNKALVLKSGRGRVFDDVEFAIKIYETL